MLMVSVMIAAALMPMVPEATELRDDAKAMRASISTDAVNNTLTLYEDGGYVGYYVSVDEAPDGVLVITPSSDDAGVMFDPSYIKITKADWDMWHWFDVRVDPDDDANDTIATITHAITGTDTVFSTSTVADISLTAWDMDIDTDVDGLHDGIDADDDGDGVADLDEEAGCELSTDCDGDNVSDAQDAFDTDSTETTDTDGDG
ncbi:MAG: hypothetical protein CMP98_15870, partial [Gammaproteobacteria bacterium]|nr:hypothetical protein [Gammaproteobacteria bacterium]